MRGFVLAVLFVSISSAPASAQTGTEEALKAVVTAETKAYFARDFETWQAGWVHDANVTRTLVGYGDDNVVVGWDNISASVAKDIKGNPTPIPASATIERFSSRQDGNLAWVEYDQVLTALRHPGAKVDIAREATSRAAGRAMEDRVSGHDRNPRIRRPNQWPRLPAPQREEDAGSSGPFQNQRSDAGSGIVNVSPTAAVDGSFSAQINVDVHDAPPNTTFYVQRAPEIGRANGADGICQRAAGLPPWGAPAPNFVTFPLPAAGPLVTLQTSEGGSGAVHIDFVAPTISDGTQFDVMFRLVDSLTSPTNELRTGCFTVTVK